MGSFWQVEFIHTAHLLRFQWWKFNLYFLQLNAWLSPRGKTVNFLNSKGEKFISTFILLLYSSSIISTVAALLDALDILSPEVNSSPWHSLLPAGSNGIRFFYTLNKRCWVQVLVILFLFNVLQAEPLSYVGPGELIGIGVLAFVIIFLLILFVAFRKKIKFRKESDPGQGTQAALGVSNVSTEASYMLHKTGTGVEGIEFKAVRVPGSQVTTGTYGEVGGYSGGPPQVMVRPTAHSILPGTDRTTSSESSQVCISVYGHV